VVPYVSLSLAHDICWNRNYLGARNGMGRLYEGVNVIELIMRQAVISHLDIVSFLPDDIDAAIGSV
jgi:hypothetical protein